MKTINQNEVAVQEITWDGVTVNVFGDTQQMPWASLRKAAQQSDPEMREIYATLWGKACTMAKNRKAIRVTVKNLKGPQSDTAAYTWEAVLEYMSGEFATGRLIAADWGQTGSYRLAMSDAEVAKAKLAKKGYEVR